jgi:H+/Cl- antiporter ClcA
MGALCLYPVVAISSQYWHTEVEGSAILPVILVPLLTLALVVAPAIISSLAPQAGAHGSDGGGPFFSCHCGR